MVAPDPTIGRSHIMPKTFNRNVKVIPSWCQCHSIAMSR